MKPGTSRIYISDTITIKIYTHNCWHYSATHKQFCSQLMIFVSFSTEKLQSLAFTTPSFSHLASCTPNKSNLHLANNPAATESESVLYRPITFQVKNLMPLFHWWGCTKLLAHVHISKSSKFLRCGIFSTSSKTKTVVPPVVGSPRLLIQYIRCYPPFWRPFLLPQPDDVRCRGYRDRLITVTIHIAFLNIIFNVSLFQKDVSLPLRRANCFPV